MSTRLNTTDKGFEEDFAALVRKDEENALKTRQVVTGILADVRRRGDRAVLELTRKFDAVALKPDQLRFSDEEIDEAVAQTGREVVEALEFAHQRISSHHEKQIPKNQTYTDELGVTLGTIWTPVDAAGLYVPGGLASYPSSVLMNAVPARVAGVRRIAMAVPTPRGEINPAVLAAARIAGVSEIYRVGGAQAVGALAYGTSTVAPVDKIVGPGNAYVAEAKRQLFGSVGIDMIAGPSEIVVIADHSANPAWVAADLLAQAEHGAGARAIAIVTSPSLAESVEGEVKRQLSTLPHSTLARRGWADLGAIIVVPDVACAAELSNRLAPEHLELALDDPETVLPAIAHAGAIFMGHNTPEAIGDYVGGSNHVLPTDRTARFASGLGTMDFMKRTSLLGCTSGALAGLAKATRTLAQSEGLEAHARSVSIRLNR
ncbi:MAG TPA: histidinol dehydrogenase [Devosia sp.]|nr:histidinol dehydrogenase [Devosia sp.]